jgi:hypothetical protein
MDEKDFPLSGAPPEIDCGHIEHLPLATPASQSHQKRLIPKAQYSPQGENIKNSENQIERKARALIQELLGELGSLKWTVPPRLNRNDAGLARRPDLMVDITCGTRKFTLIFEIGSSGEPRRILEAAGYLGGLRDRGFPVFVAPFISQRGRELCARLKMGCLDLAGNAFLKFEGIWIDRRGRENPKKEKRLLRSLFTRKSTLVIRTLFSKRSKRWTMDALSKESGASLGMVSRVIGRLAGANFVNKERGNISLQKIAELLDAWTAFYNFGNNRATGYYCDIKNRDDILDRLRACSPDGYALTLGAAASLVAPVVRSSDVHLYLKGKPDIIIKCLGLKPVEFGGNVYLVEPPDEGVMLNTRAVEGLTLVSDLQLYLDLYNYPMRGKEQAAAVRPLIVGRG